MIVHNSRYNCCAKLKLFFGNIKNSIREKYFIYTYYYN